MSKQELKQKGFTYCEAVNEARKQYEFETDSVSQFIDDSGYIPSANDYKPIIDLYRDYRAFCIDDGCQAVKKSNFIKRLKLLKRWTKPSGGSSFYMFSK